MGRTNLPSVEDARLARQAELDSKKSAAERNRLGQFATPSALADDILQYASTLLPARGKIAFLDPALGTGSFYSALLRTLKKGRVKEALGFEIDPAFAVAARKLWKGSGLTVKSGDFTAQAAKPKTDLVICNPPYVRHHHIELKDKTRLQQATVKACSSPINGLSGLYCYFMGLTHPWLAKGAISGWLIPSEFMDVNYGRGLKDYLLNKVTLLRIHRFDPNAVQFDDALVSSAVVWFKNEPAPRGHSVEFTFGGSVVAPVISRSVSAKDLKQEAKWTRFPRDDVRAVSTDAKLSDYFKISRGLATGDNSYFILSEEEVKARDLPFECFRPILPSPRYVTEDVVHADKNGVPLIEKRLFLLDTKLSEESIRERFPALSEYLEQGKQRRLQEGYLCSHRTPWYAQENRPAAPIVCTYLGRSDKKSGRPFRFILNHSNATVANVYLAMYPTPKLTEELRERPELMRAIWHALNEIPIERLLGEGRVYGGGLHKLEPRELSNVAVPELAKLVPLRNAQSDLFARVAAE